ncbi:MAG: hypothetical protein ACYS7M_12070 [Planctomycetota bacterium]|jgi:hypothetical protein
MAYNFRVDFQEMHGFPRSKWNRGDFKAVRKLKVAWDDRVTLMEDLNTEEGRYYPYPDGPWYMDEGNVIPLAYAKVCSCDPLKAQQRSDDDLAAFTLQPVAEYDFAILTVEYTNEIEYWGSGGARIEETLRPLTTYATVPKTGLRWTSTTGTALEQGIDRIFFGSEYVLDIQNLLSPPVSTGLEGTVNNAVVTSYTLNRSFAAQTLLYRPPTIRRSAAWAQLERWHVRYSLAYNPWGWNTWWNPTNGAFESVYTSEGQYVQYPLASFAGL